MPLSMETSLLPYFTCFFLHCSVFKVQFVAASSRLLVSAYWLKLSLSLFFLLAKNKVLPIGTTLSDSFDARSQSPIPWALRSNSKCCLVGPSGLEPPTLRLSVARSSQLSYGPSSQQTSCPSLPAPPKAHSFRLLFLSGSNPLHWVLNRFWRWISGGD